jgi:uncharacterized FlaG/YvyC family protein
MDTQAVSKSALGPAAKGISPVSGQAIGSPQTQSSQKAAEAVGSKVVQPLLRQKKGPEIELPVTTNLQFVVDHESRRVFIKVSDSRTGKVIIEAPPQKVAEAMDKLLGNLHSEIDFEV